mgnify:CR=1 FL=1
MGKKRIVKTEEENKVIQTAMSSVIAGLKAQLEELKVKFSQIPAAQPLTTKVDVKPVPDTKFEALRKILKTNK